MDLTNVWVTLILILVISLGSSLWIGISLFLVGLGGFLFFWMSCRPDSGQCLMEQHKWFGHDGLAHVYLDGRDPF